MNCYRKNVLFILIVVLVSGVGNSFAQEGDSGEALQVGTKESPPFVMKDENGEWSGISIELWEQIAAQLGIDYEITETSLEGLVAGVEDGSFDIGVGSLTVTPEREQAMDFTHPFYSSGLGVAVPATSSQWLYILSRFFSLEFISVLTFLALVLLAFGFLVWVFERKANEEQFGGGNVKGIMSGFWWSAVTMTTVGYGDKAPVTLGGRIIGLIWMFAGIIIISGITASITSALTVNQLESSIQSPSDLRRMRVGTVPESTSERYLMSNGIRNQKFESLESALRALGQNRVGAVVYDAPILRYWVMNQEEYHLNVLPFVFQRQDYGFALPTGSELRETINVAMLEIIISEDWKDYLESELGIMDE